VIRVALLDDHPAVLAGLQRVLERTADLTGVSSVESPDALWRALDQAGADVVVVDYELARGDGLAVCHRLKQRPRQPRVVLYSAYAGASLAVAARLAGADALVHKSAPVNELLDTIRRVAGGETVLPEIPLDVRQAAMSRIEDQDLAVAAMLLSGASQQGIAEALGVERREVAWRTQRILARVRPNARRRLPEAQQRIA
jgi:DNA-binding NarL/FixJ family response regulator